MSLTIWFAPTYFFIGTKDEDFIVEVTVGLDLSIHTKVFRTLFPIFNWVQRRIE